MSTTASSSQIEPIRFQGWEHCWRIASNEIELVVTADVGPRVIHCGLVGSQNLFKTFENQIGRSGEPSWMIRGGSRIRIGPEDREASYAPDNGPVDRPGAGWRVGRDGGRRTGSARSETDDRARGWLTGGDCAPHQKRGLAAGRVCGMGADCNGARRCSGLRLPAARNSSGASGSFKPSGHVAVHRPVGCAVDVPSKIPRAPSGFQEAIPAEDWALQPERLGSILSQPRSVRQELPRGSGGPVSGLRARRPGSVGDEAAPNQAAAPCLPIPLRQRAPPG